MPRSSANEPSEPRSSEPRTGRGSVERPAYKKRFGQHHLRSAGPCLPSVDFLDLEGEHVLEIGGGGGVLTRLLCERARRVSVWEIDPEWGFLLRRRMRSEGHSNLGVVLGDALEIDWPRLAPETRVAGNLPYNVGTKILLDFLRSSPAERAAFLVQREVADRLLAAPREAPYGGLSVAASALARLRPLGRVPRAAFRPAPKVDGAFVGFERRVPPVPAEEVDGFLGTVQAAFALRRKTLRNALRRAWPAEPVDAALDSLGWSSMIRAEELGVDDFVALFRAIGAPGVRQKSAVEPVDGV